MAMPMRPSRMEELACTLFCEMTVMSHVMYTGRVALHFISELRAINLALDKYLSPDNISKGSLKPGCPHKFP
ncbi:hypothetical protein TNCV_3775721 [Trichonephila clavipes]|nr:hypothetical protein TNCV_3775721 [Trichonephila clavipes]